VPFCFSLLSLWTALPSDPVLFDYLLLGMTRRISTLEEKHSRDQAELVQWCADFEEKYSQSQTELGQVSAALEELIFARRKKNVFSLPLVTVLTDCIVILATR
jgi:hypothetical protein